jgi:hypothetical protein
MLKTCFAVSFCAVFALAMPARAQSESAAQSARDDKACAAQGAGPDSAGYDDCLVQRKQARIRQVQQRAADLAAMPKVLDPMPEGHRYLEPENMHALEGTPPARPERKIITTKVCVTEGDAAQPETICHTDVEASKAAEKPPAAPDYRNDPLSPLAHTDAHPGDIMRDHPQD